MLVLLGKGMITSSCSMGCWGPAGPEPEPEASLCPELLLLGWAAVNVKALSRELDWKGMAKGDLICSSNQGVTSVWVISALEVDIGHFAWLLTVLHVLKSQLGAGRWMS